MRQRVVIAMALAGDPSLLIADEPTTALDVSTQAQILALIRDLVKEFNLTVLLISHNFNDVFEVADNLAALYLGRIAGVARVADIDTQRAVELITTGALAETKAATGGKD